jgi:hypothetical protein
MDIQPKKTKVEWITNVDHQQYLKGEIKFDFNHIIVSPKATEKFTSRQLQRMGLMGVYKVIVEEATLYAN